MYRRKWHFYNALNTKNYSGEWKAWYESGMLQVSGFYCHGKKCYEWKFYDEHGSVSKKGTYDNDIKQGKWYGYKDDQKDGRKNIVRHM